MSETTTTADALSGHRDGLLRYARRHLRDSASAEDMVHDVLVAALAGHAVFGHRSSLRTWLIAILKHKIIDAARRRPDECSLDALLEQTDGPWPQPAALSDFADPSLVAEHRQTLRHVLARLEVLPLPLRRTFELHVLGHSTDEVCGAMDISKGNAWVRVHRVRRELSAA